MQTAFDTLKNHIKFVRLSIICSASIPDAFQKGEKARKDAWPVQVNKIRLIELDVRYNA